MTDQYPQSGTDDALAERVHVGRLCDSCSGDGAVLDGECPDCGGSGEITQVVTVEQFRVIAGVNGSAPTVLPRAL